MFEKEVYIKRRKKLKEQVGNGLILLLGNEESSMNYRDNLYPFRQDSTFLYFFGIDQPGLTGLIDIDNDKDMLLGDNLTTEQMVWTGFKEPLSIISERVGVTAVLKKMQLNVEVAEAVLKKRKIHFLPPYRPEHLDALEYLLGIDPPSIEKKISVELIKAVIAQRSYKSKEEIGEITNAVNTTVDMQLAAIEQAREGMTEARVAGILQSIAIGAGGNLSFPTILTMQGQILHNGFSQSTLREGSMVLCDCGAETAMHYAGDLTRTFPVNKKFTSIQKEIYEIVYKAHEAAVALLKPGILFRDVHLYACEKLVEGLQQLGIMKGDVRESVVMGAHALFFPCGLGHMMGLDTHDMENLGEQYVGYNEAITKSTQFGLKSLRLGKELEEGFVITVEPGLYFNPGLMDEWAAEKKLASFINYDRLQHFRNANGTRIEEDFLITAEGKQLLGKPLAKTADEIEALR
ncbi:MAG TPA: Xaa-Pro aminopeptidase [Chitinophagaceae bacterium]|nr:Xaa-Pro aminopeptidase [Chitinophagaceae bacterium]